MSAAPGAAVLALWAGEIPADWAAALDSAAAEAATAFDWLQMPRLPRLEQAREALEARPAARVLLAPGGAPAGGLSVATLARLASPLPVVQWTPETAVEALDLAARIVSVAGGAPPSSPAASSADTGAVQSCAQAVPPPEQPGYIKPRNIRIERADLELPGVYEEKLRTRAREEPPPPPEQPLRLSAALQAGLARAGARVRQSGGGEILPVHVLVSLLETAREGIAAALREYGAEDLEALAARLRAAAAVEEFDEQAVPRAGSAAVVPAPALTALLDQTRREGRSRGAPVATTRDFLRSIIASSSDTRSALSATGLNFDLLRDLLDERHFPDAEEDRAEEPVEEPVAVPGWPDPLAGLDPVTRAELLQRRSKSSEVAPVTGSSPRQPANGPPPPKPAPPPNGPTTAPRPPARVRPGGPRRYPLPDPERPTPDLVDLVCSTLDRGSLVVFPSDLGLHALCLLENEEAASALLRFRRALRIPSTEVLQANIRSMRGFVPEEALRRHKAVLDELGDLVVSARLPWERTHSAIEALDEAPRTGWHRGWRIPAHTALLAVLAGLGRPVLAMSAGGDDPALEGLIQHEARPVALAVLPPQTPPPASPLVLDLRPAQPRIEHPGNPARSAADIRRLVGMDPAE